MSNWASLILVVPKKPDLHASNLTGAKQFNLSLCNDYRKLNNRIMTARYIKADGKLGKIVVNSPVATIGSLN